MTTRRIFSDRIAFTLTRARENQNNVQTVSWVTSETALFSSIPQEAAFPASKQPFPRSEISPPLKPPQSPVYMHQSRASSESDCYSILCLSEDHLNLT